MLSDPFPGWHFLVSLENLPVGLLPLCNTVEKTILFAEGSGQFTFFRSTGRMSMGRDGLLLPSANCFCFLSDLTKLFYEQWNHFRARQTAPAMIPARSFHRRFFRGRTASSGSDGGRCAFPVSAETGNQAEKCVFARFGSVMHKNKVKRRDDIQRQKGCNCQTTDDAHSATCPQF